MIRNNKLKLIISSVLILLPVLFGVILWDRLPARIAVHWGVDGNADGFASPWIAVFALPVFLLLLHWLCMFITSKDPKNKYQSKKAFGMIFWIMPVISLFANGVIYMAALGKSFEISVLMPIFLGLMFAVVGNYMPKVKQNRTLGIKMKTTLESEANWNATHRVAGKVWVVGGIVMLFLAFLPTAAMFAGVFILMIPMLLAPVMYSYNYRKKHKDELI